MALNAVRINDFSGGLNLTRMDQDPGTVVADIAPDEWTYGSSGFEVHPQGTSIMGRRSLTERTLNVALPNISGTAKHIASMIPFRLNQSSGDNLIMSTQEGSIYTANVSGGVLASVLSLSGNSEWMFDQSQDSAGTQYVWCLNGNSTPRKYNIGTAVLSNWGGTPPNGTILKTWKLMMVVAGVAAQPQRLYYSRINNPEDFTSPGGFIDIKATDDEADAIIALEVVGENLLVFKQRSVWVVFDPTTFDNRRLAPVGCVNRLATAVHENSVYWVSDTGVHSTDGDTVELESELLHALFNDSIVADFLSSKRAWTRLAVTHHGYLMMTNQQLYYLGGGTFWADLKRERKDGQHPWQESIYPDGMGALTTVVQGYFQGSLATMGILVHPTTELTQHLVYVLRSRNTDTYASEAISPVGVYQSKWLAIGGIEKIERLRRLDLDIISTNFSFDVSVFTDDSPFAAWQATIAAQPGATFRRLRPEVRARKFRIGLTLPYDSELNEIALEYRGGKEH